MAAAMFKGDRIAFSGGTVNPFAGTFLEDFNLAGTVDISGYFDSDLNFAVSASIASGFFVRCNTRVRCGSQTETSRRISQSGRRSISFLKCASQATFRSTAISSYTPSRLPV
jgi:hypothetical protein